MNKSTYLLLKIGTFQTLAMAVYHFFIPYQFSWSTYITNYSPTLNWSLFSLNNYFSFNLLVLGLVSWYCLKKRKNELNSIRLLAILNLSFWIFSFFYQVGNPMPLPERLFWLSIVLPAIALLNTLIFLIPVIRIFRKTQTAAA